MADSVCEPSIQLTLMPVYDDLSQRPRFTNQVADAFDNSRPDILFKVTA